MKKLILFLCFFSNTAMSLEVSCNFEEVYASGEVQNGILIFKDKKLRYEYADKDLYTLIYKENKFFIIQNFDTKIVQKITKNTEIIYEITEIIQDYPSINDIYEKEGLKIIIEKNSNNFIKRIGVQSLEANLSINIFNCNYFPIEDRYFNHFNLVSLKNR